MKLSYSKTTRAGIKIRAGQTCTEYLLQDQIKFPVNSNYTITFRAECKINRRIRFALMKNYNNPWAGPNGFIDLGHVSPLPPATTWRETIYNYIYGKAPSILEFNNHKIHYMLIKYDCTLVFYLCKYRKLLLFFKHLELLDTLIKHYH